MIGAAPASWAGMPPGAIGNPRLTKMEQPAMDKDDAQDRYWMRPMTSTGFSNKLAPSRTDPDPMGLDRFSWINERARKILGAYRRDDYADPAIFLTSLEAVLERYPDGVVEAATDPRWPDCIQRICKFPPSIAEVAQICDDLHRRQSFSAEWDARSRKQLYERTEFERQASHE